MSFEKESAYNKSTLGYNTNAAVNITNANKLRNERDYYETQIDNTLKNFKEEAYYT